MKDYLKKVLVLGFLIASAGVTNAADFTDNSDDTVTDNRTHLIWQKSGTDSETWSAAIIHCEALDLAGKTDWRLPNVRELETIVDHSKSTEPAINTNYFTNGNWQSMVLVVYYRYGRFY